MRFALLPAWLLVIVALLAACGGNASSGEPEPLDAGVDSGSPVVAGEPLVECRGVPGTTCGEIVAEVATSKPGVAPAAIRITCTAAQCDDRHGEVEVEVVFADGSRSSHSQGWESAEAVPQDGAPLGEEAPEEIDLPVRPACFGIDHKTCRRVAADAIMGPDIELAAIRSITVSCPARCTEERGEGTVRIGQEGGPAVESQFGYEVAVGG